MSRNKPLAVDLGAARTASTGNATLSNLLLSSGHLRQGSQIAQIPVDLIDPSPEQGRDHFDPDGHADLVASIRKHGFKGAIEVRPHPDQPDRYQLIYGERRLRATKDVGLPTIPCLVGEADDDLLLEFGLEENDTRRDLLPLERARVYQRLKERKQFSDRALADHVRRKLAHVNEHLQLLRLPVDVQDMVQQRPDTIRHAIEIGSLDDAADRAPLIAGVLAHELSQREVIKRVKALKQPLPDAPAGMAPVDETPSPPPEPASSPTDLPVATASALAGWDDIADWNTGADDDGEATIGHAPPGRTPAAERTYEDRSADVPDRAALSPMGRAWQQDWIGLERTFRRWQQVIFRVDDDDARTQMFQDLETLRVRIDQMLEGLRQDTRTTRR